MNVISRKIIEISSHELIDKLGLHGNADSFSLTSTGDETIVRFELHE
jgi:hypothetical protein